MELDRLYKLVCGGTMPHRHVSSINVRPDGYGAAFIKGDRRLGSNELLQRLRTPAGDRTALNRAIADTFARLQAQGEQDPVLIGAIPFDVSRPSSLNFYRRADAVPAAAPAGSASMQVNNIRPLVERNQFADTVQRALNAFASDELSKIVLSQALEVEFQQEQDILAIVRALQGQNPSAYVFSVPLSAQQTILGASPELLLSRQGRVVTSNPLAGSRPRSGMTQENHDRQLQLQHSAKDQYEHRLVVDGVAATLAPYCYQMSVSEHPHILETSTMMHLSSSVQGELRSGAPDALNLALDLHPTPAVCGTPTAQARQFILEHEGYDRHYYAGLVGWMDAQGNGEWVVTIRCGLLERNSIRLYAGAGIVSGSDPEAEWLETQAKMKTMLNVFSA